MKQITLTPRDNLTPQECISHQIFLDSIGGDLERLNISRFAEIIGAKVPRTWNWAHAKTRWGTDQWLLAMHELGRLNLEELRKRPLGFD